MGKFKMVYRSTIFLSGGKTLHERELKKMFQSLFLRSFITAAGGGR